jgi:hypothetical protein
MVARVRNRRGLIASVEPFDTKPDGRMHLVRVEYTDSEGSSEDTLVWEREHNRRLLEPTAMPRVAEEAPMPPGDFDALVRSTRWGALTPFLGPDGAESSEGSPIVSPAFGAVQVEDFQLVPLLKALQMPRVSLLLADDVGLGKTVEAGLLLTELLQRRRIRRVLILSPASLRRQWQQEMKDKFSLGFELVDREETHALHSRLGLDANPWRTFPRIIASYYYLRQPDVLEQFLSTCRSPDGSAHLPWDLLVVDEAHNLMPAPFGQDSELAEMLRLISPFFEHKVFLTATPHNGHTRSFTGLLEQLDPVRFIQKSELSEAERQRVEEVVVRRLKREINTLDDSRGRPRRFAERQLQPEPLRFGPGERALSEAFAALREAVRSATARVKSTEAMAGTFAIEVLNKRLLSCPSTFAESWLRFREGLAEPVPADAAEVSAARRSSEEELDDDLELEDRALHAARTVGAWLKPLASKLEKELAAVDAALRQLGLEPAQGGGVSAPQEDARLERLLGLVQKWLRRGQGWASDERLILFTEYKTTLDYLERRLREAYPDAGDTLQTLYGGMDLSRRESIKRSFNDPDHPVRLLLATDAAAEGLNLQETARLLLHYDIPWNPARLEQRNGRLDRHGQARDVLVHHFTSEDDADLRFLGRVVRKVEAIREDLGSMGEVFDAAFHRRFQDLGDADAVDRMLEEAISQRQGQADTPRAPVVGVEVKAAERLDSLYHHLDFTPDSLCRTLEVALGVGVGHPRLEGPDERGRMKLKPPLPRRWEPLIDDSLRLPGPRGERGPIPGMVFDPKAFVSTREGRQVFRQTPDTVLLHLGHPLFHEALATFARLRFPGEKELAPSRWTVRRGAVPAGAEALLLLTVEELALNELREPFHHWVRTLRLPVRGGALGPPERYVAPADDPAVELETPGREAALRQARALWEEVDTDLRDFLAATARERTRQVNALLETARRKALVEEKKRYTERIKEVRTAMRETSIARLERERDKLLEKRRQKVMFGDMEREEEEKLRNLEEELYRRTRRYQELLELLEKDEARVLERMLPRRYALHGDVQLFPVAVELRLPEVRS